ncbi:MAG TPA: RodZ domain-containing protein [Methylophilaceae bacterium]|nr:RodZ domain-containing protein [Methylophilaceae bacterium]
MNDDSIDDIPIARTAETPVLGQRLQEAREAQGLAVEDISNRLRLSARQVKALEEDDFTVLPEPMITRGFIRNYARLLELDPEPLLEAYRAQVPSEPPRAISIPSANIPISDSGRRPWLVFVIGALLIGIMLFVWLYADDLSINTEQTPEAVTTTQMPEPESVEPLPVPALPLAERMEEPAAAQEQADTDEAATTPGAEAQTVPAQDAATAQPSVAVPAGAAKLEFSFNDTSWVSVVDGNNEEILNETKPAGSREAVEGKPPFKVVIGNAGGSTLTYNGKTLDLAPHTRLNVVRITLE